MARKKSDDKTAQFTVKCSEELLASLKDLAHLSRSDVSSIVLAMCNDLVKLNRQRILNFRRQAATPIKFPTIESPAAQAKKKPTPITNAGDETADVGVDANAQN